MLLFSIGTQILRCGIRITLWWPKRGLFRKRFIRVSKEMNIRSLFLLWDRLEIAFHLPFKIVKRQVWEDSLKNPLSS